MSTLWQLAAWPLAAWTWLCVVAEERDRDRLALEAAGIRRDPSRAW